MLVLYGQPTLDLFDYFGVWTWWRFFLAWTWSALDSQFINLAFKHFYLLLISFNLRIQLIVIRLNSWGLGDYGWNLLVSSLLIFWIVLVVLYRANDSTRSLSSANGVPFYGLYLYFLQCVLCQYLGYLLFT